jgi:ribonucleotide monophosphatase NagD (HAD superfamily)
VIRYAHLTTAGRRAEEVLAGRPEKPAASIFLKACEMAGVQPSEAVHVGDSLKADVAGGNGAGLAATVFVSASGATAPADGPQPTFTVCLSDSWQHMAGGVSTSVSEAHGSRTARRLRRRGMSLLLLCVCVCRRSKWRRRSWIA